MSDNVRRHRDGSIDLDFYRTRSVALRRRAMRDSRTMRMAAAGAAVMVAAMGFAAVMPAAASLSHRIASVYSGPSLIR